MFQVTNLLTYHSWSVSSRDELLSELEHANARRQPLDPPDQLELVHAEANGEVLEKTIIQLPLKVTIDEALETFGFGKSNGRKGGFLGRLLPFLQREKSRSTKKDDGEAELYELPLKEDGQITTAETSSESVLNQLIKDTQQTEEQSQSSQPITSDLDVEPVGQIQEESTLIASLPNSPITLIQPEIREDDTEVKSGKVEIATLPPRQKEETVASQPQQEVAVVKSEEQQLSTPNAQPRDVESLSTYDLQMEFVGRIDKEVAVIDIRVEELLAQVEQLKRQKESHLKLLKTIATYQLT